MAVIVTPGAADANSYASIAAADAYHLARANAPWAAANEAEKSSALIRGTAWLDGTFRARWPGYKTGRRAQALDWPRVEAWDQEGEPILSAEIPAEVVAACCEAALRELTAPGSLSPDVTPGTAKVLTSVKGITWTPLRSSADASDMAPTLLAVNAALSGLLAYGGGSIGLVRA
jgi:hypothetical protein